MYNVNETFYGRAVPPIMIVAVTVAVEFKGNRIDIVLVIVVNVSHNNVACFRAAAVKAVMLETFRPLAVLTMATPQARLFADAVHLLQLYPHQADPTLRGARVCAEQRFFLRFLGSLPYLSASVYFGTAKRKNTGYAAAASDGSASANGYYGDAWCMSEFGRMQALSDAAESADGGGGGGAPAAKMAKTAAT